MNTITVKELELWSVEIFAAKYEGIPKVSGLTAWSENCN
jgi:hypothetical protein